MMVDNAVSAAAALAAAPRVTIGTGRLSATVLLPDAAIGFYRGTRFDWSGMIASVTLGTCDYYGLWFDRIGDGIEDFVWDGDALVSGRNTAALGPAEAFDAEDPPGWAEAAPGGTFVKIGVGILRKPMDGAPYSSFRLYDIADHGHWTVATGPGHATFTHDLGDPATGFGYRYVKTVRLAADAAEMAIEHALLNTGTRPIETVTFNHNFLTFGGDPTAGLPTIAAPYSIAAADPPQGDAPTLVDGTVRFRRALADRESCFVEMAGFHTADDARFSVTAGDGAAVEFVSDRPWSRAMLWAIRRTVAVEPFIALSVPCAAETRWTTRYRFTPPR